jgi:hypothetical protein
MRISAPPGEGTFGEGECLARRSTENTEKLTIQKKFGIAVVTALLASPLAVQAQGVPVGSERGAAEGSDVGGPVGGVVGGAVGGAVGGVNGVLGINPRYHRHCAYEHRSAYRHHRHHRYYY